MIPHKTTPRTARACFPVRAHAWPSFGEIAIAFFPPLPALPGSRAELSVTACPQGELLATLDHLGQAHGVTIRHEPVMLPAALRPHTNGAFEALEFVATSRETFLPLAAPARLGGVA